MKNSYSIIIPVFNEIKQIGKVLEHLYIFHQKGHEIILVDDGSDDGTNAVLKSCNFINLICLKENKGKGVALKEGILHSSSNKLVLFDGDFEIHPNQIEKLMVLNPSKNTYCVFANRYEMWNETSLWSAGNRVFTSIFNIVYNSKIKDALCCAKSFYKTDILFRDLKSEKFDIDVEISSMLVKRHKNINNIDVSYRRRESSEGKKLKLRDSIKIIYRMFNIMTTKKL